jgi:hypothetical protein
VNSIGGMYAAIPHLVLVSLGLTVTDVTERVEPVVFDEPIHCDLLDREIPPGQCVGTRMIIKIHTAENVTASARIEPRLFRPGEVEHTLWEVEGRPVTRIQVERDDQARTTPPRVCSTGSRMSLPPNPVCRPSPISGCYIPRSAWRDTPRWSPTQRRTGSLRD